MARASVNAPTRRQRQVALYEKEMGEAALARQLIVRESRKFVEPDECNCGWLGQRAREFGSHHADSCPRRLDPFD